MEFLYIVILPLFGILALWGVGTIAYGYWEGLHAFEPISDGNEKNKLFKNDQEIENQSDSINNIEDPFKESPFWANLIGNKWFFSAFNDD